MQIKNKQQKVYIYIVYIHKECIFAILWHLSYGDLMGMVWVSYGRGSTLKAL